MTNAGVLSVNGTTTVDGASTLKGIMSIGGHYTAVGSSATITDAKVLSVNEAWIGTAQEQLVSATQTLDPVPSLPS